MYIYYLNLIINCIKKWTCGFEYILDKISNKNLLFFQNIVIYPCIDEQKHSILFKDKIATIIIRVLIYILNNKIIFFTHIFIHYINILSSLYVSNTFNFSGSEFYLFCILVSVVNTIYKYSLFLWLNICMYKSI